MINEIRDYNNDKNNAIVICFHFTQKWPLVVLVKPVLMVVKFDRNWFSPAQACSLNSEQWTVGSERLLPPRPLSALTLSTLSL